MSSELPTLRRPVRSTSTCRLPDRRDGKVRGSYACATASRLFVTTDRLSAFDRIIAGVPFKGQVLNQLAAWWFDRTRDIVANHVVGVARPQRAHRPRRQPLPVEVVVRGYITGVTSTSLWKPYAAGARTIYGYRFPDGLRKNSALPSRSSRRRPSRRPARPSTTSR